MCLRPAPPPLKAPRGPLRVPSLQFAGESVPSVHLSTPPSGGRVGQLQAIQRPGQTVHFPLRRFEVKEIMKKAHFL